MTLEAMFKSFSISIYIMNPKSDKTLEKVLAEYLKGKIREKKDKTDIDIFDLLEERFLDIREKTIDIIYEFLIELDPKFFEDPNPVLRQTYPQVYRGPSKRSGLITFDDLRMRSIYTNEEFEKLKNSTVGFAGFSGSQITTVTLARACVGNFILVDPDTFESSNANRQPLCYEDVLGQYKADVGAQFIRKVNSEANVKVYREFIKEDNVQKFFSDADIIVVGTSDPKARPSIHKFGRKNRKPVANVAWSGYEGQYLTFMPDDPPYEEVLGYSPITVERGSHACIILMSTYVANDIIKMILGDYDHIIKYPKILSINLKRTMPFAIRNVEYLKKHAIQKVK